MGKSNIIKYNVALFLRAFLLLTPVILLFYQENGLTIQTFFLLQGIFYLTSIVAELPVGYLSDKINRKKLLLISFSMFLFVILSWILFKGFYIILLGEIIFAISKAIMDNVISGYLYDNLDEYNKTNKMVKYYGILNFILAAGTAVAGLMSGWLYKNYGSRVILIIEFFIILLAVLIILSIKDVKQNINKYKIGSYLQVAKNIYKSQDIRYYVFYSGLLTSYSILFVLCFQPIMQNAAFPIVMFGIIACFNHSIRALSGLFSGLFEKIVKIQNMIIPLYILYILSSLFLSATFFYKNRFLITFIIIAICLIIGFQLLFTIQHVSRLHKLVKSENRGNVMFINNVFSRTLTALILLSSNVLIGKYGLYHFLAVADMLFLIFGTYIMVKALKVKDIA